MTDDELVRARLEAHQARVSARLIRAGVPDDLLVYGVRLLDGEMDVDADSVTIDATIASWRVLLPDIFSPAKAAPPTTTRAPGAVFGAKGAAEAARRAGITAPQHVSSSAPTGGARGLAGAAEAKRRYPEVPNAAS